MQLKNVKGVIENLSVVHTKQNILYGPQMAQAAGVSAIAFSLAGMGGAAVQTVANADGGADDVDMYSFDLNGRRFVGCTRSVSFRNGDVVELVFEERPQGPEVLGIRRPESRSIWLYPYMSVGSKASPIRALSLWLKFGAFGAIFIFIGLTVGSLATGDLGSDIEVILLVSLGALPVVALGVAWMLPRLYRFSKAADQVFAEFGFEYPQWVDLHKTSKAYRKKNGIVWSAKNVGDLWY